MIERNYFEKHNLPSNLEILLNSTKKFEGEYVHEKDYKILFEKIKNTNPFSFLIFYDFGREKINFATLKKINPKISEKILKGGRAGYEQFYYIPELKEMRRGNSLGSGYRDTQTICAHALALLSKTKNIPTHVLIYDQKNTISHVVSKDNLILQPHDIRLDMDSEPEISKEILRNISKAYGIRDQGKIDHIFIESQN